MRAGTLLTQVERPRRFDVSAAYSGFIKICWGFFKKLVIADNVGIVANKVFTASDPSFPILWVGVFAFAMQIYADFSAYIDIARGTARWLGFELTENFDHPYMATSPPDFWRRWNITLSTWFRDYVYIPLGGSQTTAVKWARNVLVTFLLSGLWHGASWNYVLWGLYHGLLLIAARVNSKLRNSQLPREQTEERTGVVRVAKIAGMFVLTCFGWLLFRETELSMIVRHLTLSPFDASALDRQIALYLFLLTLAYSWPLWVNDIFHLRASTSALRATADKSRYGGQGAPARVVSWPRVALQGVGCGLAVAAILVFRSRTSLDFIYFQF
jgi:D-alanyl-lipoteichoic acid acyltransferase DltB (MBOAT superfamily)